MILVTILLAIGSMHALATPAQAQTRHPFDQPVISLCAACDDLQKQVIEQLLVVRDLDRALIEARRHLSEAKQNLSNARVDLDTLPRSATAAERQAAQARVTALDAAVTAADQAYDQAYSRWRSAIDAFAQLNAQLALCNEKCPKPAVSGGPTRTGAFGTPVQTGDAQPAPGAPKCPNCAKLVEELNRLNHLIWLWRDLLNEVRAERSRVNQQRAEMMEKRKQMLAALSQFRNEDPSVGATYDQQKARLDALDAELDELRTPESFSDEIDELDDRIDELLEEREQWWSKWNDCNRSCNPKRTQWFQRPLFWIPIAGAIGGVTVAGGGDSAPTTATTVTPPSPPVTTVNPSPSPPTTTSGRTPLATQTVMRCQCVVDTAVRDATLQFCQRVQVLNVTVTAPGTMRVVLPAPFPTFSGPFNATTGEFMLTATGASGEMVTFGGAVDPSGGFADAFVHVDVTTSRRTGYTFATAGR